MTSNIIEMRERHLQLIRFLKDIETPRESNTLENTAHIVHTAIEALSFTRNGAVRLQDLLIVANPRTMLASGSNAVYLGLDPNVDSFIKNIVGSAPHPSSVRAIEAMLAFKTFKFTTHHMCMALSHEWPRTVVASIGKFIVSQTKHGLLDGNVLGVVALLWPDRCSPNAFFPGRTFLKEEWCCQHHWKISGRELPNLNLPDTLESLKTTFSFN